MKAVKLRSNQRFLMVCAAIAVAGFIVAGLYVMHVSHAATAVVSAEVEDGVASGTSSSVSDSAASGGKAVTFGIDSNAAMHIYSGTTHYHTGIDNDHGNDDSTPADVFRTAKTNGFDFLLLTEHSGLTGAAAFPDLGHTIYPSKIAAGKPMGHHVQAIDPYGFYNDVKAQAAASTDGGFVGLAGYEYSANWNTFGSGHLTGAETDDAASADSIPVLSQIKGMTKPVVGMNFQDFEDYLSAQSSLPGHEVFGGFNHPGCACGHDAAQAKYFTPAHRAVMATTEVHNSMESDADVRYYQSFISELDLGWRVAPTCGIDGHLLAKLSPKEEIPNYGTTCRAGVLAPSLTKKNILDAILARRMYSSRDVDMQVSYKANGQWMGSIIGTPSNVQFVINVSDPDTTSPNDKITRIEVMTSGGTNGSIVASKDFSQSSNEYSVSWNPTVAVPAGGKKYYFIRVYDPKRTTATAIAAPVWLE